MRGAPVLLFLCAALAPSRGLAVGKGRNDLLRVIMPVAKATLPAHPFVNVIVGFGQTASGAAADPDTFRAHLGGNDVTKLFQPVLQKGAIVGMRAAIDTPLVRVGRHNNRLRLEVKSVRQRVKGGRGRIQRDVDRLRFRAVEAANQPPVARLVPGSDVIFPGLSVQFGAASEDPESDQLAYTWDFGDGTTSDEANPTHVFAATDVDVTVHLTVSDGQVSASDQVTLIACPALDPGRTAGVLRIEATDRLEFGAVDLGATAARTVTVRNTSTDTASQLRVRLGLEGTGFAVDPAQLDLAAGESAPVTLTFAPGAAGHQSADIVAVASVASSCAVHMLAHGFGGAAPNTGPTFAADTVFYTDSPPNVPGTGTFGIAPNGARFYIDNTVQICQAPNNGPGTGDVCLVDRDCVNGAKCLKSATCTRGTRAGQPCTTIADCPGGFCPSQTDFDVLDMCGDGQGNLFLMSDEGTFTDVSPGDTELSGSLLRLSFDASGNRTDAEIISRVTTQTQWLACDRLPTSTGRVYLAQYHDIVGSGCFRDAREALTGLRKTNGNQQVIPGWDRLDAAEGLDSCSDDFDETGDLQVSADGSIVYASFDTNGLYRILPSPLAITPDVIDNFQLHPDGAVVVATASDQGSTGLLRVYKIFAEQAVHGAVRLADLTPCATIRVPNNRGSGRTSTVINFPFAVGRATTADDDGIVLVNFLTAGGGRDAVLSQTLRIQGTAAFASPAGSPTCTFLGFINVDFLENLTF